MDAANYQSIGKRKMVLAYRSRRHVALEKRGIEVVIVNYSRRPGAAQGYPKGVTRTWRKRTVKNCGI